MRVTYIFELLNFIFHWHCHAATAVCVYYYYVPLNYHINFYVCSQHALPLRHFSQRFSDAIPLALPLPFSSWIISISFHSQSPLLQPTHHQHNAVCLLLQYDTIYMHFIFPLTHTHQSFYFKLCFRCYSGKFSWKCILLLFSVWLS